MCTAEICCQIPFFLTLKFVFHVKDNFPPAFVVHRWGLFNLFLCLETDEDANARCTTREGRLLGPPPRSRGSVELLSGFQKSPAKYQSSTTHTARKRMTEQDPWRASDWIGPPLHQTRTWRGRKKTRRNPANKSRRIVAVWPAYKSKQDLAKKVRLTLADADLIPSAWMQKPAARTQQGFESSLAKLTHKKGLP